MSEQTSEKTPRISTEKLVNGLVFLLIGTALYTAWGIAEHKTFVEIVMIYIQAIALGLILAGMIELGTFIRPSK
jgi:hypothetical protein